MHRLLRCVFCVASAASALVIAGCASPRAERGPDRPQLPPIALEAEQVYFDAQLTVVARLGRSERPPAGANGESPRGRSRPGGGSGGPPPGMGGGGGMGGGPGGDMGMRGAPGDEDGDRVAAHGPRFGMAGGPPLTLRVTLTNTSPAPLTVQIREVKSELGNFAARPERVTLAPGESAELDPMTSELGVVAAEIPVDIALRVAGANESHRLLLRSVAPAGVSPNTTP